VVTSVFESEEAASADAERLSALAGGPLAITPMVRFGFFPEDAPED
jgi:hypothetical protein